MRNAECGIRNKSEQQFIPISTFRIPHCNTPLECGGRMTVFETVGRGSIPWRGAFLNAECGMGNAEFAVRIQNWMLMMRDRLTVGRDTLNVVVLVRIQLSLLIEFGIARRTGAERTAAYSTLCIPNSALD